MTGNERVELKIEPEQETIQRKTEFAKSKEIAALLLHFYELNGKLVTNEETLGLIDLQYITLLAIMILYFKS